MNDFCPEILNVLSYVRGVAVEVVWRGPHDMEDLVRPGQPVVGGPGTALTATPTPDWANYCVAGLTNSRVSLGPSSLILHFSQHSANSRL